MGQHVCTAHVHERTVDPTYRALGIPMLGPLLEIELPLFSARRKGRQLPFGEKMLSARRVACDPFVTTVKR